MTKKKAGATFFVSDSYKDSVYIVTTTLVCHSHKLIVHASLEGGGRCLPIQLSVK